MTYSLAWHQGFAAGRSFDRLEREWVRGAVERTIRGIEIPPPAQPDCPYDEEEPTMTGGKPAVPPRNEVFDVTFHPLMRDQLLAWLSEHGWSLVCVPGSYAKIPSFIVMESGTLPTDLPSQMCAICGIPLVHDKCPICAVPHDFSPYAADVPYRWCKVCGLDETDARAHHESATA